jgi:4-alpha-glucanotransferase
MLQTRSSGILFHPTSLPGPFGIGDLGPAAIRFLDYLAEGKQSLWQMLPLNPPGYSNSPYQCYSAFAGNPMLISPELLVDAGLLMPETIANPPSFPVREVVFADATAYKLPLLHQAFRSFTPTTSYNLFCTEHAVWLDDYALFMALLDKHNGSPWNIWEAPLARRDRAALNRARTDLRSEMDYHKFTQYIFFQQYAALHRYAHQRGIRLMGDLPIFVAHNSADVWAHQELFYLEPGGEPTVVAGVPPDYFSKTGQRWGNPLYRWDVLESAGFDWWIWRLQLSRALYDLVRIDHFRGFEAYWEIPAVDDTAINGQWIKGPGGAFFEVVQRRLPDFDIVAEDLGLITPEVEALRDRFQLPGMKVLQFAFSDPTNIHLPHNYTTPNCVVYTGTHDNDTTRGWWKTLSAKDRKFICEYLGISRVNGSWDFIRPALASIASTAIIPLQDVLNLGSEARMNQPGTTGDNWGWRVEASQMSAKAIERLGELTWLYGRAREIDGE